MAPNKPNEILDPLEELAAVAEKYDSQVRLLFQLQNYISLVKYDPVVAKRDKSAEYRRFVTAEKLDLWEALAAKADTRRSLKRLQSTRKEVEDLQTELRSQQQKAKRAVAADNSARHASKPTPTKAAPVVADRRAAKSKSSRAAAAAAASTARRPAKRQAQKLEDELDEDDPWNISPDLGWPDQPPPSKRIRYNALITTPIHYVKPAYGGNLAQLLNSYRTISDDQESVNDEAWENRVALEANAVLRVHAAKQSGLLAELEANGVGSKREFPRFVPPNAEPSHYDNLLAQGIHFAKLRSNLRKFHQTIVRRNSQSIEQYFRRLMGAEDREKKELERQVRQVAKRTGQEVMKKWKLALKIVEQRREAVLAEEKREKGKEYLNQILDNSAKLIESRIGDGTANDDDEEEGTDDNAGDEEDTSDSDDESDEESDEMQNGQNDEDLTLEQLREKYRNMMSENEVGDQSEDQSGNESDAESDAESRGQSGDESEEESELEKPSEEALRLYAEAKSEGDEEDESELESGSESESESSSEEEEKTPSLAALLGHVAEDDDEDAEVGSSSGSDSEESEASQASEAGEEPQTEIEVNGKTEPKQPGEMDVEEPEAQTQAEDESQAESQDESPAELQAESQAEPQAEPQAEHLPESTDKANADPKVELSEQSETGTDLVKTESGEVKQQHKIDPPFLLKGQLREYQRNGLDWLAGLVQSGTNGILADEMGLGKTIQTIGLLAWLAAEKHIWGPHLIVVPTSVMLNWEMEFKRFAPGFKILTYFGTPQQRKRKRRGWNKEDTWHVCITSYQLVIQDQVVFRGKRWQYMVLDEAHNIKNFRSQRWQALLNFNAQYRLLLTGTPLQNNLVELWSLLYFLMPSTRATQMMPAGFASLDDFQEWFAKPVDQMVEEGAEADDEARKTIAKLHQVLRPYLLRRLKKDVEKQMPAKYEHVVYCRLSKRQRYLYDDFMSRASTRATLESGNFMSILNCLMQLRKVCNHPDLFEVRPIVTSYAVDHGVYFDYGRFVAPQFTFDGINSLPGQTQSSLILPDFQNKPKWYGLTVQELSGTSFLESELKSLQREVEETGEVEPDFSTVDGWAKYALYKRRLRRINVQERLISLNRTRTNQVPVFGTDCIDKLSVFKPPIKGVLTAAEREMTMKPIVERYAFATPPVVILDYPESMLGSQISSSIYNSDDFALARQKPLFHEEQVRLSIAFPDKRLLQYDCGKLQKLAILLRDLISNGHRCLIFTQMTRVLDILEQFLNLHGWRYLRLDGATRVEQRQALTERFNKDANIPVFILSTRSGGLGINLTGADTVIFYDSDWNPAMDRQCQDRCHRIGQTRDVHIYRLVSEYTIESNILRKATQKTILDNVVIQEGDFTTEYFTRMSVHDILGNDAGRNTAAPTLEELENSGPKKLEAAMAEAEDRDDQLAANLAMSEARMDQEEFADVRQTPQPTTKSITEGAAPPSSESPGGLDAASSPASAHQSVAGASAEGSAAATPTPDQFATGDEPMAEEEAEPEIGHIDDWMIKAIERGDIY